MKFSVAFLSVLVFAVVVYHANGLCNTCAAVTNIACVDNDKFRICDEGVPTGPVVTCPTGTRCTPGVQVCDPSPTAQLTCARCRQCDANGVFACTKYNAFSLCMGNSTAGDEEYTCPEGLVCSVDTNTICVNPDSGIGGTCPYADTTTTTTTTETITTTPNAQTSPNEFCANKGFTGRYEVSADLTCKQFIQCIRSVDGVWIGSVYVCTKDNYFNPNTQSCDIKQLPARCSTTTSAPTPTSAPTTPAASSRIIITH